MPAQGGQVVLQDLHVSDSSEAILSGRKPPFRLMARALIPNPSALASQVGVRLRIRHAVSEGFVVRGTAACASTACKRCLGCMHICPPGADDGAMGAAGVRGWARCSLRCAARTLSQTAWRGVCAAGGDTPHAHRGQGGHP